MSTLVQARDSNYGGEDNSLGNANNFFENDGSTSLGRVAQAGDYVYMSGSWSAGMLTADGAEGNALTDQINNAVTIGCPLLWRGAINNSGQGLTFNGMVTPYGNDFTFIGSFACFTAGFGGLLYSATDYTTHAVAAAATQLATDKAAVVGMQAHIENGYAVPGFGITAGGDKGTYPKAAMSERNRNRL